MLNNPSGHPPASPVIGNALIGIDGRGLGMERALIGIDGRGLSMERALVGIDGRGGRMERWIV